MVNASLKPKAFPGKAVPTGEKSAYERIATGDSQALAIPGKQGQGYFKVDLWQVILRIIGMNRAADRRAIELVQQQKKDSSAMAHVMIV